MTAKLALKPTTTFAGATPGFADSPAEARTGDRSGVRLLVAADDGIRHRRFPDLVEELRPGDTLVVNTSATVNGELDAIWRHDDGEQPVVLHAVEGPGGWVVELRAAPDAGSPVLDAAAAVAGTGVVFAPVMLHTGFSSQEAGEAPQPERFEVPAATAQLLNHMKDRGDRVIAVGTTATRALESAVEGGRLVARSGWTERVITPDDPPQVVDGLITGWHDAGASHLLLVEAIAGAERTQRAYDAALAGAYAWHEFGDSCLFL
ncbi:queuosine biosynthesis protein [Enemella dayhoffiae]|uniref:Queuosine biosynthesis protein n=1 Tax=Enemella dayhoffiae TaxID=2016507 RepID=A0A255H0H8_9ACTN|nr:S-adenosylmethionine:tRNA ribosyltransferase-isomerase [Enemella dayhoffiae]OYO21238.1 queuosine biosynthesis protein [Enemella dayhoffiae]